MDYIEILKQLLTRVLAGHSHASHQLLETRDFWEEDDDAYEAFKVLEAEIVREFRAVVQKVEDAWGPPDFIGNAMDAELQIPFSDVEHALWIRGQQVACVFWEQGDTEFPIFLSLAAFDLKELSRQEPESLEDEEMESEGGSDLSSYPSSSADFTVSRLLTGSLRSTPSASFHLFYIDNGFLTAKKVSSAFSVRSTGF